MLHKLLELIICLYIIGILVSGLEEYTEYYYYVTVSDSHAEPKQSETQCSVRTYCSGTGLICEGGSDYHECPFCAYQTVMYQYDEDAFPNVYCPECSSRVGKPKVFCDQNYGCGKVFGRVYICDECG